MYDIGHLDTMTTQHWKGFKLQPSKHVCVHHTDQPVGVETRWELHTQIVTIS